MFSYNTFETSYLKHFRAKPAVPVYFTGKQRGALQNIIWRFSVYKAYLRQNQLARKFNLILYHKFMVRACGMETINF